MDYISEGFRQAFYLLFSGNKEVANAIFISLAVSSIATLLATLVGIPIGCLAAMKEFWGKRLVITILNTLLAFPTVVVGLLVYSLLCRQGALGALGLLYTPTAMVIGQFILALPIIAALSLSAIKGIDKRVIQTALTLGATRLQAVLAVFSEAKFALLSAIMAGFGRVFTEVGVSMMVGGNIKGFTRNIPTTIALETSKGEFGLGIALGMVLLAVAFAINILFHYLQGKGE